MQVCLDPSSEILGIGCAFRDCCVQTTATSERTQHVAAEEWRSNPGGDGWELTGALSRPVNPLSHETIFPDLF